MWQVIGQERAVTLLKRSLDNGNLSHAYLLVGPPHVGKGTLALNLAQALNCVGDEPPCGQCPSCLRISKGSHADVRMLSLKSGEGERGKGKVEISIDEIKEIQHAANLPPFEGKYKVFIVDGAENLSPEASNCLLKVLEEPPRQVIFVLLTGDEDRLLPTVISRCQRIELKPMPVIRMTEVLVSACRVAPDKAELLARLSKGCLGWALTALKDDNWVKKRDQAIEELTSLLVGGWEERFHYAAELAGLFNKERHSGEEVIEVWVTWWRDLMLIKCGCRKAVVNMDYVSTLEGMAEQLSLAQIKDFTIRLEELLWQIRQNVNPRLAVEALMLDMPKVAKLEMGQECLK